MRGSANANKISAITIPARTRNEMNIRFARTRFISSCNTASYISRPIPGYENMISELTAGKKLQASYLLYMVNVLQHVQDKFSF